MLTWRRQRGRMITSQPHVAGPKSQTVGFGSGCVSSTFLWLIILSSSPSNVSLLFLPTCVIVSHLALSCHLSASGFDKNLFIFAVALIAAIIFLHHDKWRLSGFLFPRGHKLKKRETVKEYFDVTHIFTLSVFLPCIKGSLVQKN